MMTEEGACMEGRAMSSVVKLIETSSPSPLPRAPEM
jgi:hypothetical protein